ncbi:MAG: hypothetical protein JSV43_08755 [Methanobacteriota archaeon]|nr:MAG: hypothetical protein JSV43_08755 [Euryarchaeota archaeon]
MAIMAMIFGVLIASMPTVVADTFGPEITHTPVTDAIVDVEINITAKVMDVDGVDEVCLNYTDEIGESNVTMANWDDNYSYVIPAQTAAGVVEYFIWANDTVNNENRTANATITVSVDSDPPEITHTPVTDADVNQVIPIAADVVDNVGVYEVRLNYTEVNGDWDNVTMTKNGDTYTYDIPAQSAGGDVEYFIWANDTNNLENRTANTTITVAEDTDAPTITHTVITTWIAGTELPISATITDTGLGVEGATLYYRKTGDTTFQSLSMTGAVDLYTANIPASAVTTDGVEYYISATDGTNVATHPATDPITLPHQIPVTAAEQPAEELPWIWIIIAIIIIVIIIVAVAAAARGRGGLPEEEPLEEAPMEEEELP